MRIKLTVAFLLLGGVIIGAAVFAEAIGLDNDPGWGMGRIAILFFGILILAIGVFRFFYPDAAWVILVHKVRFFISRNTTSLLGFLQRYWYTFPILIFIFLVYIWFASSGSWTHWEPATHRYADLAISFRQGKLYLAIRPNLQILSLPDPYDPLARKGINYPVDYSLYKGKFYFYWGPVPALLLAAIDPFTRGRVGDLYLVFSFVCGIFFLQYLLMITIWDRFFGHLPKWILAVSIFVVGLIVPWTYILVNEPNGRIYEAAISGAQFFLMGGFLVVVLALNRPVPSSLALALAGFSWALAIGTRLTVALPIGFIVFMVVVWIWKTPQSSVSLVLKLTSLGLPLILGFIGLGWYNWARFDSVTETGLSYQLSGANMQSSSLFSPIYIIRNLHNYLFQPPSTRWQFPFLYPKEVSPVIGLLFIAPFTLFALLPVITLLRKVARNIFSKQKVKDSYSFLDWITTNLFFTFLLAFCMILIYFWSAMRFLGDFMPALTTLSMLGFWQGYQLLAQRSVYQKVYSIFGAMFASAGAIVNILISIAIKQFGRTGL